MIYDLGGGTLDVSIVRIEGEVTEVLASHGNNQLSGDDFDQKLVDHLLEKFFQQHHIDLHDKNPAAYARLWWAAEAAKKQLSYEPYARILEESLIQIDGKPLHLDVEISREKYEEMTRPLLDQTLDGASKALSDAGLLPQAVDAVLLVGGSTRTPLVLKLLEQMCGKAPRTDLHPDLCVALAPACWPADWADTMCNACSWTSHRTHLASVTSASETACLIPTVTIRSFAEIRRCR